MKHSAVAVLKIAAVISSVVLLCAYVLYRSAGGFMGGTKSGRVMPAEEEPRSSSAATPTAQPSRSVKLSYSTTWPTDGSTIGPDFAIAADTKVGIIAKPSDLQRFRSDPAQTTTTKPAVPTTRSRMLMPGSKSGNIDAEGQNVLYGDGHVEATTQSTTAPSKQNP